VVVRLWVWLLAVKVASSSIEPSGTPGGTPSLDWSDVVSSTLVILPVKRLVVSEEINGIEPRGDVSPVSVTHSVKVPAPVVLNVMVLLNNVPLGAGGVPAAVPCADQLPTVVGPKLTGLVPVLVTVAVPSVPVIVIGLALAAGDTPRRRAPTAAVVNKVFIAKFSLMGIKVHSVSGYGDPGFLVVFRACYCWANCQMKFLVAKSRVDIDLGVGTNKFLHFMCHGLFGRTGEDEYLYAWYISDSIVNGDGMSLLQFFEVFVCQSQN
jgi:hypothetical protein